ncbi:hypothetical protein ACFQV2_33915 [Actinokineospora soli]|uniref:Uncharacterized protein n=1 Tax=Actinokineospora soli TaxID=1048753 RepID=A0ABW2TVB0_9PSEU
MGRVSKSLINAPDEVDPRPSTRPRASSTTSAGATPASTRRSARWPR